jgi:hypothetical protein
MDLTTSEGIATAQLDEPIPNRRAILEDGEAMRECRGVGRRLGRGERLSPKICCRVITAIYSRRICRLTASGSSSANRTRPARA